MHATEPALECIGLTKRFGRKEVLRDVSLTVAPGSIVALVGANGAGKTTLLKTIAGLILPSSGRVLLCGRDAAREPMETRRRLGFLSSEERSFFWRLSGRENLKFFAALQGVHGPEGAGRIAELLERTGLDRDGGTRFQLYSSGMKQLLGMARALIHDPPVLLLDEPTRSLGSAVRERLREMLRQKARQEGTAVLMASHDLGEVEALADRVAVIGRGAVRAEGTVRELRERSGMPPASSLESVLERWMGGADIP